MQNLRQLQQNSNMKSLHVSSSNNASNTSVNETNNATSPRRGIKTRSPRKTEPITRQTSVVAQSHTQSPNIMTTITPAALVVAKPLDSQHPLTLSNQSNVQQIISNVSTSFEFSYFYYKSNDKKLLLVFVATDTTTTITASYNFKWKISKSDKSSRIHYNKRRKISCKRSY